MRWLCRLCELSSDDIVQNPVQHRGQRCEKCGKEVACYLNYEEKDKRPTPKKSIKRRLKSHRYEIRPTVKTWKALKTEAKRRAVSIHSLIMTFINDGLNPKTIISGGYVPTAQKIDSIRTDTMMQQHSSKRKKKKKSEIVSELEQNPRYLKMKKRYG